MNRLSEFDGEKFTIFGFCDRCGHSAAICQAGLDPRLTIKALNRRLRCRVCGETSCSIRIVYTGAGKFRYRSE